MSTVGNGNFHPRKVSKKDLRPMTAKEIEAIFSTAVEGASSNAYWRVYNQLEDIEWPAHKYITVAQLTKAILKLRNKWEKSIEDYLDL